MSRCKHAVSLLLALLLAGCATGDAIPGPEDGSVDAGADFTDPDAGATAIDWDGGDSTPRCVCSGSFCGRLPECEEYCPCPVDQHCDEETNTCGVACPPQSDEALCEAHGAVCGELVAWDNCNTEREVQSCGSCPADEGCSENQCLSCAPQSDAALCAAWGRSCGTLTRSDDCGQRRTVRCGACLPGSDCELASGSCLELKACVLDQQCADPLARCVEGFCRACLTDQDCDGERACDPQSHQCVECLNDEDCAAQGAGGRCEPTEKSCVECLVGSDCQSGWCDPAGFACVGPPPANDGCAGAAPVALAAPGATVLLEGDTGRARDDATSLVCGSSGKDLAFLVTLGAAADVSIEISPAAGSSLIPVLYARGRCDSRASELGCAGAQASGLPVRLELPGLPAGSFALWVDAAEGSAGAFELTVEARAPATPAGHDTCAAPAALELADGAALVPGDTRGATDDYAGLCAYSDGPDLAYRFELAEARKVTATVRADPSTPAFRPAVYLRATCEEAGAENERACGGAPASGGQATAVAGRLDAGSWYAIVDGAYGTAGFFALALSLEEPEPLGDGCADAFALDLSSGRATVQADLAGTTADAEGSCGGSGPDAVYRLELAAPLRISASVIPGPTLQPVLHLRRNCGPASAERACVAGDLPGDPAGLGPLSLEAGSWFLWVDGFGGSRGAFELTVSVVP